MINNQKYSIILPGRIVTYDKLSQTATIQISAETAYSNSNTISELATREPLENVPVQTPSGGGWSMTMPIKAGNTCILFFSQVGYDHWLYEDKDSAGKLAGLPMPWLKRQFSEDDGFAIVGMNTIPRAIKDYSMDGSQWRNEDATQNIHLREDLSIEINSTLKVTVNAPSVIVNCDTSEVNASATTTVTCPKNEIVGNLKVDGNVVITGELSGLTTVMSSTVTAASYNGVVIETHTHLDAEDRPTLPPT